MTHRERLQKALNHQEPDRVPMDLGSSANTGITLKAWENLKAFLGRNGSLRLLDKAFQLADITEEDEFLDWLGIDTRGVFPTPLDPPRERMLSEDSYEDEWGLVRKMPAGGFYYDVVWGPFWDGVTPQAIERFPWPVGNDPSRVRGVKEKIVDYARRGYGVVVNVRGGFIFLSQLLRGFEGWFEDLLLRPEVVCDLLDRTLKYQMELAQALLEGVGEYVDVVVYGDDLGIQNGPMVSPALYRKYLKPRQAELFATIRRYTQAKIHYHTCGSVYALIPDFIEIGVDILNPVQVSAKDMEPERLKREFGDRLSFWGAVDTQRVLPRGTPEEVEEEVRRRIRELAPGGGYVLCAVHNIQPDVPPENILALFQAGRKYGTYPIG